MQAASGTDPVLPDRYRDAQQIARGQAVYTRHCLECYGVAGKGLPGDWRIRDADVCFSPPLLDGSAHAWHPPPLGCCNDLRRQPRRAGQHARLAGQALRAGHTGCGGYIKSLWSDEAYQLWWKMERQSLEP